MSDPIARPSDPAPRVLMSYAVNSEFATPKLTRELAVLAESMLSAFGRVGVVPIVTDAASTPVAAELLDGCDGVVILGGADLDPVHYGQPCRSAGCTAWTRMSTRSRSAWSADPSWRGSRSSESAEACRS